MNHTFKTLEFDKILERLADFACTEGARERIRELEPFLYEGDVKRGLKETTEARTILDGAGNPPVSALDDLAAILITAVQGGCLSAAQLESVSMTLAGVGRMKEFLYRCRYLETGLAHCGAQLESLEDLRKQLAEAIGAGGVTDGASRYLREVRQNTVRLEEKLRLRAESVLKGKRSCFADQYVTMRNGRLCLPVKKECKASVPGSVIGQSASGATLFIEPEAVAHLNAELEGLKLEEENEIRRILYVLTAAVADNKEAFDNNKRLMENLDFVFAKGKLSAAMKGVEPNVNTERRISIVNGVHPLMERESAVPLEFSLGEEGSGIVITGPNTGGKTVAMKTVGLLSLMAQCGLHVPCRRAELAMNNQVLCDIGDGQSLSENLSTFSAHITNVLGILEQAGPESLVLLDELGSGTDPAEGMGIAIAILESLRSCGCLFLVTTHYPQVKDYALKAPGVLNARMEFDRETLKPLYRLILGEAGESCALFIAEKLGMPKPMYQRAREAALGRIAPDEKWDFSACGFGGKGRELRIRGQKTVSGNKSELAGKFKPGDSVLVYPDKKIGIVCQPINEKGLLQVQMRDGKIWLNQKRVKLHVAAEKLYPEDYDFSIIFDSVENRKIRHQMGKRHVEGSEIRLGD